MNSDFLLGKTVGKCVIESLIGVGGMGWVYKAKHTDLDIYRAIKVLKPIEDTLDPRRKELYIERFLREARLAANLHHKNIIRIHDVGSFETSYYIEMEYLEGQTLREFIAQFESNMPEDIIACIMDLTSDAMHAAHSSDIRIGDKTIKGLVHRDLKPDNIFITNDGQLKVLDFGIAKVSNLQLTTSTEARNVTGTLAYMSPEQIDGIKDLSPASDIFSLGVVYYEMVTGKNPFISDQMARMIKNISSCDYVSISKIRPGLHKSIDKIISKMLLSSPAERIQDASMIRDTAHQILLENGIRNTDVAFREFIVTGDVTIRDLSIKKKSRNYFPFVVLLIVMVLAGATYKLFCSREKGAEVPSSVTIDTVQEVSKSSLVQPFEEVSQTVINTQKTVEEKSNAKSVIVSIGEVPVKKMVPVPQAVETSMVRSVPAEASYTSKSSKYVDSIGVLFENGQLEAAVIAAMDARVLVKYVKFIESDELLNSYVKGLRAYEGTNYSMAASFFEAALRKRTSFSKIRIRVIEDCLLFKARAFTMIVKRGDSSHTNNAISSWDALLRMTKSQQSVIEAKKNMEDLR